MKKHATSIGMAERRLRMAHLNRQLRRKLTGADLAAFDASSKADAAAWEALGKALVSSKMEVTYGWSRADAMCHGNDLADDWRSE